MQATAPIEQHSVAQSLLLHLLPGALIAGGTFALVGPIQRAGYPSILALTLAVAFILVPVELGVLLVQGKRRCGRFALTGVVCYRRPLPFPQYLLWVPLLFVVVGVVFTLLKPVDGFLQQTVFSAWPALDSGLHEGYARSALIVTYAMVALFGALIGPVVEELYFRGFLLPRMAYAGKWAPLLHSFLFALYHLFTPWMLVTRTVGMLPLAYAAQRRNLAIPILVHVLANALDVVTGIAFIAAMNA